MPSDDPNPVIRHAVQTMEAHRLQDYNVLLRLSELQRCEVPRPDPDQDFESIDEKTVIKLLPGFEERLNQLCAERGWQKRYVANYGGFVLSKPAERPVPFDPKAGLDDPNEIIRKYVWVLLHSPKGSEIAYDAQEVQSAECYSGPPTAPPPPPLYRMKAICEAHRWTMEATRHPRFWRVSDGR